MKNEEYKDDALLDGENSVNEDVAKEITKDEVAVDAIDGHGFNVPKEDGIPLPLSEADGDGGEPFDPEIICDDLIPPEQDGEPNVAAEAERNEGEEVEDSDAAHEEDAEVSEDEEAPEEEVVPAPATLEKPRRVDSLFDFIEICIFTLASVFILMSFFFRYSIVDGNSMLNTLHDKERLVLTSFLYTPECGDIVVVQDKSTPLQNPIVKRVIAIGGQKVAVTPTAIFVNGEKLDEPYVYTEDYPASKGPYRYSTTPSEFLLPYVSDYKVGSYYEVVVPEGMIFVMGDHRNDSTDSREIGLLHEDAIIGKAIFRFYPFDKFGKIE